MAIRAPDGANNNLIKCILLAIPHFYRQRMITTSNFCLFYSLTIIITLCFDLPSQDLLTHCNTIDCGNQKGLKNTNKQQGDLVSFLKFCQDACELGLRNCQQVDQVELPIAMSGLRSQPCRWGRWRCLVRSQPGRWDRSK